MIRRSGVSLIEVLVAIFVTSIGLLALLALFPLGAVNMAQAVKDTRTALSAADAAANIKSWLIPQPNGRYASIRNDSGIAYTGTDPNGPSFAVFVDPIGFESYSQVPGFGVWVGGTPGISRQTLSIFNPTFPTFINNAPKRRATMLHWFSLLDDITFGTDGLPGASVQRENRYSWAYLLRLPRLSDHSVVEMTVAVYERRPLQLGTGGFVPVGESTYAVEYVTADPPNTVSLVYGGGVQKPALRAGGWILDSTPLPGHGYFYRVVSVSDSVSSKGQPAVKLELQENIRTRDGTGAPVLKQAIVMDNLAEVFEKGPVPLP